MRTYGKLALVEGEWWVTAEPQVAMLLKRIFIGLSRQFGTLKLSHTAANAETIEWVLVRYPLEMSEKDQAFLFETNCRTRAAREASDAVLKGSGVKLKVGTKLPLRSYQLSAVELMKLQNALLCGDDLGLGKTGIGLGLLAAGMQPVIVVCKTHLQQQWWREAHKFVWGVKPHIVKQSKFYRLPEHNMLIITYSKLAGWAEILKGYQLIVFDEAQELRRDGTNKYAAATHLCSLIPNRLGLTATPVYNYGDEIFNLIHLLRPGALGTRGEFLTEWCEWIGGDHYKVRDPKALGGYLAESHLFLRRRRRDVGRELPAVTRISEEVEYDSVELLKNEDRALELAKLILRGTWNERGKAAMMFVAMMRMQTGIAKAPFVADFVAQLALSGEAVVLAGWHREVYVVWQRILAQKGIKAVLYTGSESPVAKEAAVKAFLMEKADVFIISLRSGEGLNGLQERSNIIVFGELDWSPQVHEQCIGRLNRDGQADPVTAVYLYSGGGSDPVIAGVLGIKKAQSEGIINPGDASNAPVIDQQVEVSRAAVMAKQILERKGSK